MTLYPIASKEKDLTLKHTGIGCSKPIYDSGIQITEIIIWHYFEPIATRLLEENVLLLSIKLMIALPNVKTTKPLNYLNDINASLHSVRTKIGGQLSIVIKCPSPLGLHTKWLLINDSEWYFSVRKNMLAYPNAGLLRPQSCGIRRAISQEIF